MSSPKFATIAAAAAAASGGGVLETKTDTEDTDSQLSAHSYSNNSSPPTAHPQPESGHRAESPEDAWNNKKKASQQITKQLVQETLMDEGLRVIKELANQIRSCADAEALDLGGGLPVSAVASSPSPMMPLSLTCGNKGSEGGTGRPRGRPPRLDRGDFVGTSRTISGSATATPPPSASPLNMSRGNSNSPNPTSEANGKPSLPHIDINTPTNGHHHKTNGSTVEEGSENSLNALLALSQKGMLKQEPGSPSTSPSQQSIKI